jgi:hypothetical protein
VLDHLLPRAGLRSSAMLFVVHVLFFLLLGTSVGALPNDLGPHFPITSSHRSENLHISGHGPSYAAYVKSQGRELPFFMIPGIDHKPHSSRPLRLTGIAIHAGVWYREPTKVSRTSTNFRVSNTFHSMRIIVTISLRSVFIFKWTVRFQ